MRAPIHFIPLMGWKDISEAATATLLGAFASFSLVAPFLLDRFADRVNKPKLLPACHLLPRFLCRRFCWIQVTDNGCFSHQYRSEDYLSISLALGINAGSRFKISLTARSSSLPSRALISRLAFFASAKNSGSLSVSVNALRNISTRSFGVPGGRTYGRAVGPAV